VAHQFHQFFLMLCMYCCVCPRLRSVWIHPVTLRRWAIGGKIPFSWAGRERRFSCADAENMKRAARPQPPAPGGRLRRCVLGASGQESSLAAEEEELRAWS